MNASAELAAAVIGALRRGLVTDVVLAPGSRSAALAVALHEADAAGLLRLHVRIDERSAAYLALGLAKGQRRAVAVVTTSGSAVANLHPAVLEASHAGERLIVLSADRPAMLRGTGANQTTDQPGIFGHRVPCTDVAVDGLVEAVEAVDDAVRRRGPTHVNLQLAEPLLPDAGPMLSTVSSAATGPVPDHDPRRRGPDHADDAERLVDGPLTVVVAGDDAGPPARLLAEEANWPLLAEPTSGARTGSHALRTSRLLLTGEIGRQVERVVVTGHPTLSRPVVQLISRSDIDVVSVRGPGGVCTDPGRVARHLDVMPVSAAPGADDWMNAWRTADAGLSAAVDEVSAGRDGRPLQVAAAVADAVCAEALLMVGSSQPVRDLDIMMTTYPPGERRRIIGNRGLSGIDGTVSTAVGAALGRRSSRALAFLGDLTFLHDANGLVIGPDEPRPDLTLVVTNDDGGAIFSTLEQGSGEYADSFERVFGTPHGVDLSALCAATRTAYERVVDVARLRGALAEDTEGIRVLEVPLSRAGRRALDETLRSLVE
jgi:2-succinyl-5-enolpyruvyl-6-hydroxy-3-cyclohexene-1-carboxylate synthase